MSKTIVIMGNGPSMKEVNWEQLRSVSTFGMNGAYRFYYRTGWWPTYFCCFDFKVTKCHQPQWNKMIKVDEAPIERYFFWDRCVVAKDPKVTHFPYQCRKSFTNKFHEFGDIGNTGSNACQVALCLGYTKLILIGIECNYVEQVNGSVSGGGDTLVMKETPTQNPNYFFDDYQQSGDIYNKPRPGKFHLPAWKALRNYANNNNIDVVNCSPVSQLNFFRRSTMEKELG